jgi:hypothetical protein
MGSLPMAFGVRLACLGVVREARWWLGFGECVVDGAGLARAVVLSWVEERWCEGMFFSCFLDFVALI